MTYLEQKTAVDTADGEAYPKFISIRDELVMWYVIQTLGHEEEKTIIMIEKILNESIYKRCIYPTRRMKKKIRGEWRDVTEKLVPGYIFIFTEEPLRVYSELKKIPLLTKLLGREGGNFVKLDNKEIKWLEILMANTKGNGSAEVGLSQVGFTEGDEVQIISGPLTDLVGYVKKINLHKRQAELEVEFMGRKMDIYLGIEFTEKILI